MYKVIVEIELKHLYFVCHISRIRLSNSEIDRLSLQSLSIKEKGIFNKIARETVASGRFMRGTDPIKSTWVYPKLIL